MQVLAILLLILKIIGIIILSLLGLVILVLAILLFAPALYKADGDFKDENYRVDAVLYWLIVKIKYIIDDKNEGKLEIIFPFGIGSEEHKRKKETKEKLRRAKQKKAEKKAENIKKEKAKKTKAENIPQIEKSDAEDEAVQKNEEKITEEKEPENMKPIAEEKSTEGESRKDESHKDEGLKAENHKDESGKEDDSFVEKAIKFFKKVKAKFLTLIQKPKQIYNEVMDFIAEIREMNDKYDLKAVTKETFSFLRKFFVALGLKKFKICGIIGLDDPADTGQLLAAISMVAAFVPIQNNVAGDFQKKNMDLNAELKGRTNLFKLIYVIVRYVLSESILPIVKDYTN
jgi:hypothetical protein